jgi:hypothetical protein
MTRPRDCTDSLRRNGLQPGPGCFIVSFRYLGSYRATRSRFGSPRVSAPLTTGCGRPNERPCEALRGGSPRWRKGFSSRTGSHFCSPLTTRCRTGSGGYQRGMAVALYGCKSGRGPPGRPTRTTGSRKRKHGFGSIGRIGGNTAYEHTHKNRAKRQPRKTPRERGFFGASRCPARMAIPSKFQAP